MPHWKTVAQGLSTFFGTAPTRTPETSFTSTRPRSSSPSRSPAPQPKRAASAQHWTLPLSDAGSATSLAVKSRPPAPPGRLRLFRVLPHSHVRTRPWTLPFPPGPDRFAFTEFENRHPHPDMLDLDPRKLELVAFFRQQRHESLDSPPLSSNTGPPQGKMRQTAEETTRQRRASNVPIPLPSHPSQTKWRTFKYNARANVATKEGQLAKACSALIDVPLALDSESVAQ